MPDTTRIIVGKNDEATVVAEQLIDAETDTIIFVVQRGSVFAESLNNFKLLKREGDVLSKEIIIESDDETVQEKAVKAGLEIGQRVGNGESKDRLPRGRSLRVKADDEDDEEPVRRVAKARKKVEPEIVDDAEPVEEKSEEPVRRKVRRTDTEAQAPVRSRVFGVKHVIQLSVGIGAALMLSWVLLFMLPTATIQITLDSHPWNLEMNVIADKTISAIDVAGGRVPGQVFTQKSTVTTKMPATGSRFVTEKATGVITVYNAYSSQPQSIVANTRFVTPAGAVFRIAKALTIPGAKIEGGTIIPSSVTATVVADAAGVQGNVGPTPKLLIPGFIKTPKYNGFYGELKEGTTGGFSGQAKVATESDVKAAKAESAKRAETVARDQMKGQIPEGFKSIDAVTSLIITRQVVSQLADAEGNFSVTTDAQLSVFAFKEADVKTLVAARRDMDPKNKDFVADEKTATLSYVKSGAQNTLFTNGRVAVPITYAASLTHTLDEAALKKAIAGRKGADLQTIILGTPGVSGGSVDFFPFYVASVPSNTNKITIFVQ